MEENLQNLTIQDVLAHKNDYNLAVPFVATQQINPFFKMSVSLLYVDMKEEASQIFKIGSRNFGNDQWKDLYALSKPFLERLATEAGVQFCPGTMDISKVDENTWKASAFGAIRLPDNGVRTSSNTKVIDLATEEKKYRLAYEEKAKRGIADYKAAKETAKKYAGKWVDTDQMNDKGYPVKLYMVSEQEREKYIENSLLDAMTQLRANAPQKAATGAKLRVIRDLLGIKGTYTIEELKKPFAVARTSFSPDYNDPVVKQMLLQQAMQSVGNLFGNVQPVVQTISIPKRDVYDEVDFASEVSEMTISKENREAPQEDSQRMDKDVVEAGQETEIEDRSVDFRCDKCDCMIQEKVWNYSVENFGRPLCYKCQRIVKREQKGGRR